MVLKIIGIALVVWILIALLTVKVMRTENNNRYDSYWKEFFWFTFIPIVTTTKIAVSILRKLF